ncbi:MAG: GumC family protein [Thermaurantimonas sp.]
MSLIKFIRLFSRNLKYLMTSSILLAVLVFLMVKSTPKEYESETEIFTGIASGLNLTNVDRTNVDFFATSNAYDNLLNIIKSRQTLEEVGEELLALHISLDGPTVEIIGEEAWRQMMELLTPELFNELKSPKGKDSCLVNIKNWKSKNYNTFRGKIIFNQEESPYSFKAISKINVSRIQNSDLINIKYRYTDPGICKSTLEILSKVFIRRMYEIKASQSNSAVEYFRKQVAAAREELSEAEDRLKQFRVKNNIINYGEQTKSLATMKEQMEDEFQKELAVRASTKSALDKLETQLSVNKELIRFSDELLEKRRELAKIQAQITTMEIYYNDLSTINTLRRKAQEIRAELSDLLTKRYQFSRTTEGVPNQSLLDEWLKYTLALDESEARLRIFDERRKYFEKLYNEFAPLGSLLARYEREIGVAEKNYLELLHSLNQAIMRQQNDMISAGGLVVSVPPYFPLKPLPSKTAVMVAASGIVGFVLPFIVIILLEFFDSTLKNPIRAESVIGKKLLGSYPSLQLRKADRGVDLDWVKKQTVGLSLQTIRLEQYIKSKEVSRPFFITVISTRAKEGRTLMIQELANRLVMLQYRVLVLMPDDTPEHNDPIFFDRVVYKTDKTFEAARRVEDLIPPGYTSTLYDYLFIEFPSLMNNQYPINVSMQAHMHILIARANRTWVKADEYLLDEYSRSVNTEIRLLLNRVNVDELEVVLGDIPKDRSYLRKLMKRFVVAEFKTA